MSTASEPERANPEAGNAKSSSSEIGCEDAARLIAAFVHGGLGREPVQLLHRHLDSCAECKRNYRESLEAAGRLGASLRDSKQPRLERETSSERNKRIVALSHAARKGKRRPFALRALMVTAGMIFLFSALSEMMIYAKPADVHWLAGEVSVGPDLIGSEADEVPLIESNWCITGADSKARVLLEDTIVEMGSKTRLLLEDRKDHHFVMGTGRLVVDGPAEFLTPKGAVQVIEGLVTIELKAGVLTLKSGGGRLEYVSALGVQQVGPGDPALIVN